MNPHSSLSQNRSRSTHHILAATTLAAMRIGGEAKKAETTPHSATAAGCDPNYVGLNMLAYVRTKSSAAGGITKMDPPTVGTQPLEKAAYHAGGVSMTPNYRHHRPVSSVHGRRLN